MNQQDSSGAPRAAGLQGKRVLVVDDDPAVRCLLCRVLTSFDARVTEAADGREALEVVTKARFDVILTDVFMSGVDGFAVTRAVRQRDLDVAVVFVTGGANCCPAAVMAGLDVFDWIPKPFRWHDVHQTLVRAAAATQLARSKREVCGA